MKKGLHIYMLVICLIAGQLAGFGWGKTITASNQITEHEFIAMVNSVLKKGENNSKSANLLSVSCKMKSIQGFAIRSSYAKLTREKAAVYLDKVDVFLNGSTYDKSKYQKIVKYKRISDLSKAKKSRREAIVKVYMKGIMVGNSNGYYVQSRKFKVKAYLTKAEAKTYISRVADKAKRKKISPDGQVIRTEKLPKNAKSYPYILSTYPNWFYERTFEYQKTKFYKEPVALKDYASPVQIGKMQFYNGTSMQEAMDRYLMDWCKKVETNMKLRFNVDYRTISTQWVNNLRKTYYMFDEAGANKAITDEIREYVRNVKRNKVIVKASRVTVEPSAVYYCGKDYVRVYVRFKILQCKSDVRNSLYYDEIDVSSLKKGKWIEKCFDIGIGSFNGNSLGADFSVVDNKLLQA